jgi:thiosulfate/3-mercaptopyruvate sulfurtransferase
MKGYANPHLVVSPRDLAASLEARRSGPLLLLDLRPHEAYTAGHIPGALNRPYTQNLAADGTFRPPRELRSEFDGMLHGRPADDLVHYCGSGVSACHNVLAMAIAGYPLTRIYPGSWSEWIADPRRPVSKGQI